MKSLQALLALFACAFLPLHAASLADLTYTTTDGKVTITDCNTAASGELVIPDTIGGKPVTYIGTQAFSGCTNLKSITISNGVTSIGYAAFIGCGALTSITIPDGVTSIGVGAFRNCTSLTSITIPASVTSIGDWAFSNCDSLTSITIPASVTSIGDWAFSSCTSLTAVTFLGDAPTVGSETFSGVAVGAVAVVASENLGSYKWNTLSLSLITADQIAQLEAQLAQMTALRDAAIAERDARPTQAAYDTVVTERDARPTAEQLATVEAERDARPTQAALTEAIAQRDARFTEDQINAMTTNPTVGRNAAGNMQVDISFIHSTDLKTFTPFAVSPAWVSVVDGKIALEFPPSDENTFFYRLGVQ
jgi:hypothetical protein